GKALVGLTGDAGDRELPGGAEGAVAGAGVVAEGEFGAEAGAAGAERKRDGEGAGAADRVGRELLVDAADGATPFRKRRDGGRGALRGRGGRGGPGFVRSEHRALLRRRALGGHAVALGLLSAHRCPRDPNATSDT